MVSGSMPTVVRSRNAAAHSTGLVPVTTAVRFLCLILRIEQTFLLTGTRCSASNLFFQGSLELGQPWDPVPSDQYVSA
jgi:hypothetical protein